MKHSHEIHINQSKVQDKKSECSQIISDIIQGIEVKDKEHATPPKVSKVKEKLLLIIGQIKTPSLTPEQDIVEDKSANLKRINSTSPKGSRGKNIKITVSPTPQIKLPMKPKHDVSLNLEDLKEDLKLVKEERNSLKQDNQKLFSDKESLRKENSIIITTNYELEKKLIEQEKEVEQAMQEIADEEVKEREKLNANYHVESTNQKDFQKQIKEHEKKYSELKKEKDDIMEDMVKNQKEKDLLSEKLQSIEKDRKIQTNLKLFDT